MTCVCTFAHHHKLSEQNKQHRYVCSGTALALNSTNDLSLMSQIFCEPDIMTAMMQVLEAEDAASVKEHICANTPIASSLI